MRKLDVAVTKPPFGIEAVPFAGARLMIKARTGEFFMVDMSRAATEALRDQLDEILNSTKAA